VVSPDPNFWRGRKTLITGHTGFKGGWLALWLHKLGAQITGIALPASTSPSLYDTAKVKSVVEETVGDIRNADFLMDKTRSAEPEIIFHLAAQPLVRASYDDPLATFETNVMGTLNVLEAARRTPSVKAIVNVTSDKCYENHEWHWPYRETDQLGGRDPYSASKACAEIITSAYRKSFFDRQGVFVATARAGNVIGGGDWASGRLIPDILRACQSREKLQIRAPSSTRPWQHVFDSLAGYLSLAELLYSDGSRFDGAWNFGPALGKSYSVQDITEKLIDTLGVAVEWEVVSPEYTEESINLKLDISKAQAELKWQPTWGMTEALEKLVAWHESWVSGADMQKFSFKQIDEFMSSTRETVRP
jgi:CDP-glucose 4,6-dehydratase